MPDPANQEETVEKLCEVEGIKFYDTPEMGIACRVSEINLAIAENREYSTFQTKVPQIRICKRGLSKHRRERKANTIS